MTKLFAEVIMSFYCSGTAAEMLEILKWEEKHSENQYISIPSTLTQLLTNQLGLAGKYLYCQNEFFLMGSSADYV